MRNFNSFTKISFLIIIFTLIFISKARATGPIIINEIMYDLEGADSGLEWVELKNISSEPVDLTGWKFNDGSNHLLNIPPKNGGQGGMVISPQGFAILADKADLFLQNHPNFLGTVIDTAMSLNNTAATLRLIDNNGNIVEEASYIKTQGGNGNGFSLERVSDNVSEFCESNILGGTPGQENNFNCNKVKEIKSSPTLSPTNGNNELLTSSPSFIIQDEDNQSSDQSIIPTPTATPIRVRLIINEFLPNPIGNDQEGEWIEIFNDSEIDIPLRGWRLEDASGQKYYFKDEIIQPKNFLVLTYKTTKITLNNNGETLSLYSPNNELAFQISYSGNAEEGFSYARAAANNWKWTSIVTPGKVNQFDKEEVADKNIQQKFDIEAIVENNSENNQRSVTLSTSQSNPPAINQKNQSSNFSEKIILLIIGVGVVFSIASAIFIKKVLP
ncbi:MAG: lamin tail domain-containing protein [Patescibacteria group bacterium]|jgi:hypothetical protein|nr:lamin tail domain-containing protein [Patescibacteria group bacterium]